MQIVNENNLGEFLERKALKCKEAIKQNASLLNRFLNLCLVFDECKDDLDNAHILECSSFKELFLKKAKEEDGYFKITQDIKALDFMQLNFLVNQCANFLKSQGLKANDKVASFLQNSLEFVILYFACFKSGIIFIPVNACYKEDELAYIYEKTKFNYIVAEDELLAYVKCDVLKLAKSSFLTSILKHKKDFIMPKINPLDLAMILFTSGTTAKPKGCKITHYNLLFAGYFTLHQIGLRQNEVFLSSMPNWHIDLQATALMPSLRANACFVLLKRFSARRFWQQIVFYEANISEVVPKMIELIKLQNKFAREKKHKLRFLLYFLNMSNEKYLEFKKRFKVDLFTSYGLSESIVGCIGDNYYEKMSYPAIGKVFFAYEVIVANIKENKLIPLKANELGTICIKGRLGYELFAGYYEDELNTKNSFIDGYFISNDIGYFDENALFYFFSRNKDLIKINGENISSLEIENLLSSHKKINNASVICISDALACDKIIAFLELKDYPYEEEVNILQKNKELKQIEKELIALNLHLAKFKQVSEFIFLNHLPRNYLGKVRKNVLGEIYGRN
ncbi:hypothetical protein A9372_01645 [Campylobacter jejuni]|nr:hypothetical protein [Campylobacter jejuni]